MNRRRFLSLLALGAPATVVAEKVGLIEKVRTYFFAPPGGSEHAFDNNGAVSGVCALCGDAISEHEFAWVSGGRLWVNGHEKPGPFYTLVLPVRDNPYISAEYRNRILESA